MFFYKSIYSFAYIKMISIWELTEALTLEWAKQDLWGLGAES